MLESVSLQKNRLRSAKNVIFSLLCILVDRPMGRVWTPDAPLRTPLVPQTRYKRWRNTACTMKDLIDLINQFFFQRFFIKFTLQDILRK